ncbi:MAG: DUF11 domain-containing protein [Candidatus Sericytochromatia bacterium]|nr:DUF11 domain-containing protein [Candidatus Sericytochromatia bacterium]
MHDNHRRRAVLCVVAIALWLVGCLGNLVAQAYIYRDDAGEGGPYSVPSRTFATKAVGDPLSVSVSTVTMPPLVTTPPGTIVYRLTIKNIAAIPHTVVPRWTMTSGSPAWTYPGPTSVVINAGAPDTTAPTVTTDGTSYLTLNWKPGTGYPLAVNDTLQVTFSVGVPGGTPAGWYGSQAYGQSLTSGVTVATGAMAGVTVKGSVSADIGLSASPSAVTAPGTVNYKLRISNNSNSAGPVLSPKLTLTHPNAVVAGWSRNTGTMTMTWSRPQTPPTSAQLAAWNFQDLYTLLQTYGSGDPNLNAGEWVQLNYAYAVSIAAPSGSYGSRVVLTGGVYSMDSGNLATVSVGGQLSSASVTQAFSPDTVAPGGTVSVTTSVANSGTLTLSNHDVSELLPDGFTQVAGTAQYRINNGAWTALGNGVLGSDGALHWIFSAALTAASTLDLNVQLTSGLTTGTYGVVGAYASAPLTVEGTKTFAPTDLGPTLKLWLDAADASTVSLSGSNVTQWNDKSGNSRHAVQAIGVSQPSYDATTKSLVFNGSSSYMTDPLTPNNLGSTAATLFAVVKPAVAPTNYLGMLFWRGTATGLNFNPSGRIGYHWMDNPATYSWTGGPAPIVGSNQVVDLTVAPASQIVTLNGTDYTNTFAIGALSGTTSLNVGQDPAGGRYFNGTMSEVIICDTTLSLTDRQKVEGLLAWKWGAQGNLPVSHPYKTFSPTTNGTTSASGTVIVSTDAWTPALLGTTVQLWLDGSDASTITKDGSNRLSQWNDKSGFNRHAVQATLGNQPVHSSITKAVTFNGTSSFMTDPLVPTNLGAQTASYYVVMNPSAAPTTYNGLLFWRTTATGLNFHPGGTFGYHWMDSSATYGWTGGPAPIVGTNQVVDLNVTATSQTMSLNGTDSTNASTIGNLTGSNPLNIGQDPAGGRFYNGSMSEIIICNTALSPANKQKLEGYLAWKWGTQGSLPAAHPHKSSPPQGGTSVPQVTLTVYSVTPATIAAGGATATYTLALKNNSPLTAAKNATVRAVLPGYLAYRAGTSDLTIAAATGDPAVSTTLVWDTLGDIAAGQTLTLSFNVAADSAAPPGTYYVEAASFGTNFTAVSSGAPPSGGSSIPPLTVTTASAVDLAAFTAEATPARVTLRWRSGREVRHLGYRVFRSPSATAPRTPLHDGWIGGPGDQNTDRNYNWHDDSISAGTTLFYWLEDTELGGLTALHGPLEVAVPQTGTTTVAWQPTSTALPATTPISRKEFNAPAKTSAAYLTVDEADRTGATVTLRLPPLQARKEGGYTRLVIPGLPTIQDDGQVELPMALAGFGLPVGTGYTLAVLGREDPLILSDVDPPVVRFTGGSAGGGTGYVPSTPRAGASSRPTAATVTTPRSSAGRVPVPQPASVVLERVAVPSQLSAAALQQHMQFGFSTLSQTGLFPAVAAVGDTPITLRDMDLLRVKLYPVVYEASTRTVTQYRTLRLRLSLNTPADVLQDGNGDDRRSRFDLALSRLAADQGVLVRWRSTMPTVDDGYRTPETGGLRLSVDRSGLHRLTAARLQAAGFDLSHPDRWQLWHRGHEVPMHLRTSAGQVDSLTFYAEAVGNRYTATARYDLVVGTAPGRRMATFAAAPDGQTPAWRRKTVTYREPSQYISNAPPDAATDHWFSDYLATNHEVVTKTLAIPDRILDPITAARLTVTLASLNVGKTAGQRQKVGIWLNDALLGHATWTGAQFERTELTVPAALLRTGDNAVRLQLIGEARALVYFDRLDLTYGADWQADGVLPGMASPTTGWVATIPDAVATTDVYRRDAAGNLAMAEQMALAGGLGRLSDPSADATTAYATISRDDGGVSLARQAVVAGPVLHDPALCADYLIITPAAFAEVAADLAAHREQQGLKTLVVPVERIYEEFAGGHPEPQAIQAFLRWAAANWQAPTPSYVLLLGDGHYDALDRTGQHMPNPLPPLMSETRLVGEVPDDTRLVSQAGGQALPPYFVGRMPVNSVDEARAMVAKVKAYDAVTAPWTTGSITIHDDDDPAFADMAARFRESFPARRWDTYGVRDTAAMKDRLHLGAGLTTYIGHGSDWGWTQEDIFNGDDLPNWLPNGQAGVVIAANCLNGYFASPWFPSLGEAMMAADRTGAVAFLSSSGFTLPTNQAVMLPFLARYTQDPGLDLGTALTLAKLQLYLQGGPLWEDEVSGWLLLGDPATRLKP